MIFKFLYDFILVAELFGDFYAACEGIPLHGNGNVVPKRYLSVAGVGEIEHVHVGEGFALTAVAVFYNGKEIPAPLQCSYHIVVILNSIYLSKTNLTSISFFLPFLKNIDSCS